MCRVMITSTSCLDDVFLNFLGTISRIRALGMGLELGLILRLILASKHALK